MYSGLIGYKSAIFTKSKLIPAGQLRTIVKTLPRTNKYSFENRLNYWLEIHQEFLNQQTTNPETGRKHYTHKRLRSAVNSIQRNLPFLFTWQENIEPKTLILYLKTNSKIYNNLTKIPNTTNHLDGGVNTKIKELVHAHRGMKIERRNKLISILLINLGDQNSN